MPDPISWEFSWPYLLGAFLGAYLIGSIPFGLILTRIFGDSDLRAIGSGNIGASNVLRTGKRGLAAATLALDAGTRTIEQAHLQTGYGGDLIRINWQDAIGVNGNTDSLRMIVSGGADAGLDRLVAVDDGTDDLVVYRKSQEWEV